jgi:hypothetical protein
LEVPVSVIRSPFSRVHEWFEHLPSLLQRAFGRICPSRHSLVPRDRSANHRGMVSILHHALKNDWPCVELATHSSELMPGCSPFFPDEKSIDRLYSRLDAIFSFASKNFQGMTLEKFREKYEG